MLTTITLLAVASEGNAFVAAPSSRDLLPVASPSNTTFFGAFSCPAGSIDEGEGCEGDINDPCFGSSGAPGFISDGQTICGNLFTTTDTTDPANPVDTRDLDWFLFTHAGGAIDLTFAAEADMFLTVIPYDVSDPAFCDNFSQLVTYTYAPADGERAEQVFAAAGDYFLVPFGIDFDGYDCGAGDFAYYLGASSDPNAVCEVSSEAGDDVEVEPCGVDANGGCNGTLPFQFENISAGVTFSGTSYSGVVDPADPDGGEIRDTDWMLYDHPGGAIIYTSIADFPFQGLVVNNVDDCIDAGVIYATEVNAAGCIAQTDVSGFIPAGTYAIWAGVALNDDGSQRLLECAGNYRITITSDTTVTDPCDGIVNDGCSVVPDFIYPANAADPLLTGGGVSCAGGGISTENTFANPYSATDIMPGMELSLSCVSFGLQNTGTSLPATVQVWLDSDGGAPTAPGVDLTELGSPAQYCSNAGTGIFQATFPEPVVIPADANFVVSLDFPPSTDGFASIATTDAPTVSETYILSASCGLTTFVSYDNIGFPDLDWGVELYFGGDVSLPCPTDLDDDGDTDFNDILIVLSNFGSDGSAGGDADEDGDVDFNDLITLLSAFGPCP